MFASLNKKEAVNLIKSLAEAGFALKKARNHAIKMLELENPAWIRSAQRSLLERTKGMRLEFMELINQVYQEGDENV